MALFPKSETKKVPKTCVNESLVTHNLPVTSGVSTSWLKRVLTSGASLEDALTGSQVGALAHSDRNLDTILSRVSSQLGHMLFSPGDTEAAAGDNGKFMRDWRSASWRNTASSPWPRMAGNIIRVADTKNHIAREGSRRERKKISDPKVFSVTKRRAEKHRRGMNTFPFKLKSDE